MDGDLSHGVPSSADLDRLAAEWHRRHAHGRAWYEKLPWRARARLAVHRTVDAIGLPLARHGHYRAAKRLWRLFGMWR